MYQVPGDGQCLYSSVGFLLQLTASEVRTHMLSNRDAWYPLFAQSDPTGVLASQILAEIRNPTAWGGEPQICIAAALWRCQFDVVGWFCATAMRVRAITFYIIAGSVQRPAPITTVFCGVSRAL